MSSESDDEYKSRIISKFEQLINDPNICNPLQHLDDDMKTKLLEQIRDCISKELDNYNRWIQTDEESQEASTLIYRGFKSRENLNVGDIIRNRIFKRSSCKLQKYLNFTEEMVNYFRIKLGFYRIVKIKQSTKLNVHQINLLKLIKFYNKKCSESQTQLFKEGLVFGLNGLVFSEHFTCPYGSYGLRDILFKMSDYLNDDKNWDSFTENNRDLIECFLNYCFQNNKFDCASFILSFIFKPETLYYHLLYINKETGLFDGTFETPIEINIDVMIRHIDIELISILKDIKKNIDSTRDPLEDAGREATGDVIEEEVPPIYFILVYNSDREPLLWGYPMTFETEALAQEYFDMHNTEYTFNQILNLNELIELLDDYCAVSFQGRRPDDGPGPSDGSSGSGGGSGGSSEGPSIVIIQNTNTTYIPHVTDDDSDDTNDIDCTG